MSPPDASLPLLRVAGLSGGYLRKTVFRDVSFAAFPGEILAIVGENGAGKSTLLRVLVGLRPATSGTIEVRGSLGYCPQELTLFEMLTVRENLRIHAAAHGLDPWEPVMDHWLDRLSFADHRDTLISRLSGGTRQKLNLSLALLHGPSVLVLDEPYAAFDWHTYLRSWEILEEMRAAGCAVLVVSHLVFDLSRFDRVLELRNGRVS